MKTRTLGTLYTHKSNRDRWSNQTDLFPRGNGLKSNSWCGLTAFFAKGEDPGKQGYLVIRRRCGAWGCAYCGPKKLWRLRCAILEYGEEFQLRWFLTLTVERHRAGLLTRDWDRLRSRLRKRLGGSFSYIWVKEFHRSGDYHLHVLLDGRIDPSWMSRIPVAKATIKPIVDLESRAEYITKRVLDLPPRIRRCGSSRNIKLFKKPQVGPSFKQTARLFDEALLEAGSDILDVERNIGGEVQRFWTQKPPEAAPSPTKKRRSKKTKRRRSGAQRNHREPRLQP